MSSLVVAALLAVCISAGVIAQPSGCCIGGAASIPAGMYNPIHH
jgi:hypothetical protein